MLLVTEICIAITHSNRSRQMDPLSISAGIVSLLQATNTVISVCYDFRAAVNQAPWSLTRTLDGIKELRDVLETIERRIDRQDCNASNGLEKTEALLLLQTSESNPVLSCLRELKCLQEIIDRSYRPGRSNSKTQALKEAITWSLKDHDVTLCLARVERCKSTLKLALAADEITMLQDIRETTIVLKKDTECMNNNLVSLCSGIRLKETDEKNNKILQWLSPIDPSESHRMATDSYQEGTSGWFVQCTEFRDWFRATVGILWLSGFPGAGKSVIFSRVVTYLIQTLKEFGKEGRVAYFYCDFRRPESQKPLNVIGSLVAQLCCQSGNYPEDLVRAFDDKRDKCGRRQRLDFKVLKQALQCFAEKNRIILLIDALDECEGRESLLDFVQVVASSSENISILMTSRNEADIHNKLLACGRVRLEHHLEDMDHDVASYVENRLNFDPDLLWLDTSVKEEIRRSMRTRSKGMFRWAQCQMDSMSSLRTVKAIRIALKKLPRGLDETYGRILNRVPMHDAETTRRVLLWLAFAVTPLTLDELHTAIAIEPDLDYLDVESQLRSPEDILSLCCSLIAVTEEGTVSLAHLSVKDFLLSAEIKSQPSISAFAMSACEANHELAGSCIGYILFAELGKGPSTTSEAYVARQASHPLLKHAAVAWPYYFRASVTTPQLICRVSSFFSPVMRGNFMSWVQVLNANTDAEWDFYPRHATPVYYASSFGLTESVESFIESGADLNEPGSRYGGTALHGAVLRDHIEVMNLLLSAGADPNRSDINGVAPLHTATSYGYTETMALLLSFGASKQNLDNAGESALDWAIKAGRQESIELLLGAPRSPKVLDVFDSVGRGVWVPFKTYFPEFRSNPHEVEVVQMCSGKRER